MCLNESDLLKHRAPYEMNLVRLHGKVGSRSLTSAILWTILLGAGGMSPYGTALVSQNVPGSLLSLSLTRGLLCALWDAVSMWSTENAAGEPLESEQTWSMLHQNGPQGPAGLRLATYIAPPTLGAEP